MLDSAMVKQQIGVILYARYGHVCSSHGLGFLFIACQAVKEGELNQGGFGKGFEC
jgi:hypothetical protein